MKFQFSIGVNGYKTALNQHNSLQKTKWMNIPCELVSNKSIIGTLHQQFMKAASFIDIVGEVVKSKATQFLCLN